MKYLTRIHALNLPCKLETCGDWHASALAWEKLNILESSSSFFGEYGIEKNKYIPALDITMPVANHIRALLDMLIANDFANAQGMRDQYLCNSKYNEEIFQKILLLKEKENFSDIHQFMCSEYKMQWMKFYNEKVNTNTLEMKPTFNKNNSKINNINSSKIDSVAITKCNAYNRNNNIDDLADLVFIGNTFWETLTKSTKNAIIDVFSYKGLEYVNYLLETKEDDSIDKNKLRDDFLNLFNKLGLIEEIEEETF